MVRTTDDAWFYATYLGDTLDDEIVAEINQLFLDERIWSDATTASGQIDLGEVMQLIAQSQRRPIEP